uniref:hypothetical protein n=1 Tax=Candidatus Electronema sp. TaxID=2698783 RepID=UPI004057A0C2
MPTCLFSVHARCALAAAAPVRGTSPETLSRIYNSMNAEGLFRVDGRKIDQLKEEVLRGMR